MNDMFFFSSFFFGDDDRGFMKEGLKTHQVTPMSLLNS
jgi:hypothetical protein